MEYIYKNTKKCKYCGADIAKNANRCPNCGTIQGRAAAIVVGVSLVITGIILFGNGMANFDTSDNGSKSAQVSSDVRNPAVVQTPSATPEPTPENKPSISAEEFEAISTGMTYAEVVEIVGSDRELSSEVDLGMGSEYKTSIYIWKGNSLGANANVTFQGGKVIAKAQIGLK